MKISPLPSTGITVGSITAGEAEPTSMVQKMRSLKMNTNATPGRIDQPPEVVPENPPLSISDDKTENSSAVDEATQPLSPQFAALARQRRALQQERQILDKEKAEFTAAKKEVPAVDMARLKSDPLGVMLEAGVTYDQLTDAVLAAQNGLPPEIRALQQELKTVKEDVNKTLTERETQAEQAALAEMRVEATRLSAQGEQFELVRETKSLPKVMDLIVKTYKTTGEVLDVSEALQLVETELIKDGLKIAGLKKLQTQLAPAAPVAQPPQQARQMRTLTNRDTATVPMSRKARALAAWAGTLKK